jgi:hypothetical protein
MTLCNVDFVIGHCSWNKNFRVALRIKLSYRIPQMFLSNMAKILLTAYDAKENSFMTLHKVLYITDKYVWNSKLPDKF